MMQGSSFCSTNFFFSFAPRKAIRPLKRNWFVRVIEIKKELEEREGPTEIMMTLVTAFRFL